MYRALRNCPNARDCIPAPALMKRFVQARSSEKVDRAGHPFLPDQTLIQYNA